jgi:hypothetical protein
MLCKGEIIMPKGKFNLSKERDTFLKESKEIKKINEERKINLPDPSYDSVVTNNISISEISHTEE